MSNKVKYNLKNVHAAKLTESVVDGVTSFSYDTPKAIPGAVSISLDAEGDSSPFYADGIVYFRTSSNNGYSGDLEMALIPEWFRTEILREKLDNKGVLLEKSDVSETEKFALLFEFDGDVKAIPAAMVWSRAAPAIPRTKPPMMAGTRPCISRTKRRVNLCWRKRSQSAINR